MFILNPPKFYSSELSNHEVSSVAAPVYLKSSSINKKSLETFEPSLIDIDWLALQPLLPFIVHLLPANLLYRSLVAHGFEDSIEVIEWVRGEQLQKILDFDLWENSKQFEVEDVSVHKALSWIKVWLTIGPEFTAHRFLELEEETITLILSKMFEIIPDGVGRISEEIRENWWLTLDKKFFLRIRENADESFEIIKQFVDCLYAHDIRLAGSLFAYSAMLVRHETLDEGLRWRENRLADQGFIQKEEALKVLTPKTIRNLKQSVEEAKNLENEREKALKNYKLSSALFLENESHLTSEFSPEEFGSIVKLLTSFEPDEGIRYIHLALGSEKTQNILGSAHANVESFYDDEDFINEISENIVDKVKNIILNITFRAHSTGDSSSHLLIEKAIQSIISEENKNKILKIKESISYLANCVTSATFNTFSYDKTQLSALVTRGAINIGLEFSLKMPEEYGIKLHKDTELEKAIECIDIVGISFLFHLGWNLIFKVVNSLTEKIMDLDINHPIYRGKLSTQRKIKFSDNSTATVSIDKLVSNLRFIDVEKWLFSCENILSNELFFTFKSLLCRVPLYPNTLTENSIYVKEEGRPFETLNDINSALNFIQNLSKNFDHMDK